jgi:hypothetical protein
MTPEEVYNKWHSALKQPDDSMFYYHPNVERILLGLSIFVLTPQPAFGKLGKAEPLKILHSYVPDLITAWIDGKDDTFESMFDMTLTVSEAYLTAASGYMQKYPSKRKAITEIMKFFVNATGIAGDMKPTLAEDLLDALSTDGAKIYSDKVAACGTRLLALTRHNTASTSRPRSWPPCWCI